MKITVRGELTYQRLLASLNVDAIPGCTLEATDLVKLKRVQVDTDEAGAKLVEGGHFGCEYDEPAGLDRDDLSDFVHACFRRDVALASALAGRLFEDGDAAVVDQALRLVRRAA